MSISDAIQTFFATAIRPGLFAGAGISARGGVQTWQNLLKSLAEHIRPLEALSANLIYQRVAEDELLEAANYYFQCNKLREGEKYRILRDAFKGYDASVLTPITRLPFSFVATTNYDRSLFDAYAKAQRAAPLDFVYGDPEFGSVAFEHDFHICRIHGCAERPRTIRLSSAHYDAMRQDPTYADVLGHYFSRTNLLFVGFSFLDPAIQFVLETLNKRVGPLHDGLHTALLPVGTSTEFVQRLERLNIARVFYDPADSHAELWKALSAFTSKPTASPPARVQKSPFEDAKRYLASCYARIQLGPSLRPLARSVVEGMACQLIQTSPDGIDEKSLVELIRETLRIDKDSARDLARDSAKPLLNEGLVVVLPGTSPRKLAWAGKRTPDETIEAAISRLSEATCNRFSVIEGGIVTTEVRACVEQVLWDLVLTRGWDLGAAYCSGNPPEDCDVGASVTRAGAFLGWKALEGINRSVTSLLRDPAPGEQKDLAALSRASFALELVLNMPRDALFHGRVLPERIYLDANVLMPALTTGHPFHNVYRSVIARLTEAATESKKSLEVCVTQGILNEVVSHRDLSEREVKAYGNEGLRAIATEVGFFGAQNINVFIGAYSRLLGNSPDLQFSDFLAQYAPYSSEDELAQWLKQKKILVIKDSIVDPAFRAEMSFELQKGLADDLARGFRNIMLIDHDSVQISLLNRDAEAGRKSLLVSADKKLRHIVGASQYPQLADRIFSHIGLAQMTDLMIGLPEEKASFGRLAWSTKISSETQQLQLYLINRAAAQYDEGILMNMGELVEEIAAEAIEAAPRHQVTFDPNTIQQRESLIRFMQGYEDRFFAAINEKIQRRKGQSRGDK